MSKKNDITDEEKALFREAIKGTVPLKAKDDKHTSAKSNTISTAYRQRQAVTDNPKSGHLNLSSTPLAAEDIVRFARQGLQHKQLKKLQKGQLKWQASLDLHGMSLSQAESALKHFISGCQQRGYRHVIIIHGKGSRSAIDKPLMKNFATQFLETHPAILALSSALPKDGGTGALYAIIKRDRSI